MEQTTWDWKIVGGPVKYVKKQKKKTINTFGRLGEACAALPNQKE